MKKSYRLLIHILAIWSMVLITIQIFKHNNQTAVDSDTKQQIEEIHTLCEGALGSAK